MKITIFLAFIFLAIVSCKKTYTCACRTTLTRPGYSSETYRDDASPYTSTMSKSVAQAACDDKKASLDESYKNFFSDNGLSPNTYSVTATTTCDLK
jgi:hypothetical protein